MRTDEAAGGHGSTRYNSYESTHALGLSSEASTHYTAATHCRGTDLDQGKFYQVNFETSIFTTLERQQKSSIGQLCSPADQHVALP
jgi:hypothetical protein